MPVPGPGPAAPVAQDATAAPEPTAALFGDLDRRPVTEHVAVFEAEHARLQRELATIDQL